MTDCDCEVTKDINNTINNLNQLTLIRMLHTTMVENAFFSSENVTPIRLDHVVGYSQYLSKDHKNKELEPNMEYFY